MILTSRGLKPADAMNFFRKQVSFIILVSFVCSKLIVTVNLAAKTF